MNVGGARLDGPRDQLVDKANDRRLAGQVLEPFHVGLERSVFGEAIGDVRFGGGGSRAAVEAVDRRFEFGWNRDTTRTSRPTSRPMASRA